MITNLVKKVVIISAGLLAISFIVGAVLGIATDTLIIPYARVVYGILILIVLVDIARSLEKISTRSDG